MNRKDIFELKRRFKKDQCTITKMAGCYVNGEKKKLLEFRETFLNLKDEEFFKYLEITKKLLSGGIGNNLLELNFPIDENFESEKQGFLMRLKKSGLKDDNLLREFYQSIIDSYDFTGNYLIVVFHDVYDVMVKTSDNIKLDESEEVYEYMMCAICPVSLSKPALGYFNEEKMIKARIRDWVVGAPTLGFTFPAFIDRSSDVNALMYYTKNAKEPHPELMEQALGCGPKQTATIQKESFQSIIKNTISFDDETSDKIFIDIQENLNTMVEDYNDIYEDTDATPIALSREKVKSILIESGVSEEDTAKIEATYEETFGDDVPLAESLVDAKIIKANAQKKKEDQLIKQVESLETKLEEVQKTVELDDHIEDSSIQLDSLDNEVEEDGEELNPNHADVVLHVKPDKISKIKTEVINGQRCILVPINDDEEATINGIKNLI